MDKLRKLDFFRKPQQELQQQTFSGACLSLLTICAILCLLLYSALRPLSLKSTQLQIALSQGSKQLDVDFNIVLYHSPCASVTFQQRDKTRSQNVRELSAVKFQRVSSGGAAIADDYVDREIEAKYSIAGTKVMLLLTGLKDEERCRISGSFAVNKVPGMLSISHVEAESDLAEIKDAAPELHSKLNLAHKIMSLTFGSNEFTDSVAVSQGGLDSGNAAKGLGSVRDAVQSCSYYMRILPHIHRQLAHPKATTETYKYTVHSNCHIQSEERDKSKVVFFYETLPIVAVREERKVSGLFVVLAVVCGVYVVMGVLNNVLLKVLPLLGVKD